MLFETFFVGEGRVEPDGWDTRGWNPARALRLETRASVAICTPRERCGLNRARADIYSPAAANILNDLFLMAHKMALASMGTISLSIKSMSARPSILLNNQAAI